MECPRRLDLRNPSSWTPHKAITEVDLLFLNNKTAPLPISTGVTGVCGCGAVGLLSSRPREEEESSLVMMEEEEEPELVIRGIDAVNDFSISDDITAGCSEPANDTSALQTVPKDPPTPTRLPEPKRRRRVPYARLR